MDKGMQMCLPGLWGDCREVLVLGQLSHLRLTSAVPSLSPVLPAAASFPSYPPQVSPVAVLPAGHEHREGNSTAETQLDAERERGSASPKFPQSPAQPPTGPQVPWAGLWSLPVISRGLLNFLLNLCSPGIACKRRGADCCGEGMGGQRSPLRPLL